MLRSILDQEVIATEALLREYADILGSTAEKVMEGATKLKGQKTSMRKLVKEQVTTMEEALAQFSEKVPTMGCGCSSRDR